MYTYILYISRFSKNFLFLPHLLQHLEDCATRERTEGVREHLRSVHGELAMSPAVCPVCAAMPWGSASYTTPNLLQHFQLRHRFDYDTTTDFGQDEDAVLQEVLRRSMEQQ